MSPSDLRRVARTPLFRVLAFSSLGAAVIHNASLIAIVDPASSPDVSSPVAPPNSIPLLLSIAIRIPAVAVLILVGISTARDLWTWLRNYNLPRALFCNDTHCGYFDTVTAGTHRRVVCQHPWITHTYFDKRRRSGITPGCPYSVQVNAQEGVRPPATDYVRLWQAYYSTVPHYDLLYKVLVLAIAVFLILDRTVSFQSLLKTFSGLK